MNWKLSMDTHVTNILPCAGGNDALCLMMHTLGSNNEPWKHQLCFHLLLAKGKALTLKKGVIKESLFSAQNSCFPLSQKDSFFLSPEFLLYSCGGTGNMM